MLPSMAIKRDADQIENIFHERLAPGMLLFGFSLIRFCVRFLCQITRILGLPMQKSYFSIYWRMPRDVCHCLQRCQFISRVIDAHVRLNWNSLDVHWNNGRPKILIPYKCETELSVRHRPQRARCASCRLARAQSLTRNVFFLLPPVSVCCFCWDEIFCRLRF